MDEENPSPMVSASSAPAAAPPPPSPPAPPPPPPPFPPPSSKDTAPVPRTEQRLRFAVELRPGETTIVSWKRLLKESNKAVPSRAAPVPPPSGAHPALESRIAPAGANQAAAKGELKEAPPPNRFSAVIEKIERLYMGKQSDEEELDDIPDDDEYDTEDSFIDDAELDEYFQVDQSATKYNGFFVNRGKLERINEPISSPKHMSKKRRRKDSKKSCGEMDGEQRQSKHVKMGNGRMKAAARSAPLVGNKLSSLSKTSAPLSEHHQDGKLLQSHSNALAGPSRKKNADSASKSEHSVKVSNKNSSLFPMETKDAEKHKSDTTILKKDHVNKKIKSELADVVHQAFHDKGASFQDDPQLRKSSNDTNGMELPTKVRHKEKHGGDFPGLNSSGSKYHMQKAKSASTPVKDASSVRPKGTMLERAIRELENMVAVSRPPNMEFQEVDASSQGVKRRLPRDVKQKLAKVARLAQSSQGRISDELITRLMGILGHIVQVKTLKRNLKEMVELGLSAKQAKDNRFQQIKKEVIEMIKIRAPLLMSKAVEQRDGSSDDFQETFGSEEKGSLKERYNMDHAMEDKICDLYDLYVEGMDEDKGPQSRKLYVELAELWPNGCMDNLGIKTAVYRAKQRKRALYMQHRESEKIKRKKPTPAVRMEETTRRDASSNAQARAVQERQATDTGSQVFTSPDKPVSNPATNQQLPTVGQSSSPFTSASGMDRQKPEKVRGSTSMLAVTDEISKPSDGAIVKKKVKKKLESDISDIHPHSRKLPSPSQQHHAKERHKSLKLPAEHHQNTSLHSAGLPGCEQPS